MTEETGSGPAAPGESGGERSADGNDASPGQPAAGPGQAPQPPGTPPPPGYGPPPGPPGYAPRPTGYGKPWAPKPGIIPLRPLTVGEILDGSFTALRWNPKPIIIPSVLLAVVEGVLATVISVVGQRTILSQMRTGPATPGQVGATFAVLAVTYGVLAIVTFLGTAALTGFVTGVIGQAVLGSKETLGSAWRAVRPRIWPAIGGLLLASLFVGLGWAVAVALSVGVGFAIGAGAHLVTLGVMLGVVLGLAATVFAVIVGTRWLFVIPAVVLERAGPMRALGRSWRLVRGSWWRVFGIMLLVSLIVGFVSSIIRVPFQAGGVAATMGGAGGVSVGALILSGVGLIISSAVTAPLQAGAVVVLYTDLRMRREGMDIALQAATASGARYPEAARYPGAQPPGVPEPGSPGPGAW